MKSFEESLHSIQEAISAIKDPEAKRKAQEEFEKMPKDLYAYRIVSPVVSGISFLASTDKEIIYEEYAKKVGQSMLKYWQNSPDIYVEIKGNDKIQILNAADSENVKFETVSIGKTADDCFDIAIYYKNRKHC